MIVIDPIVITPARLLTSTAAEPGLGEGAWNAEVNYAVGQEAVLLANHRVYEQQIGGINADSPDVLPQPIPRRWLNKRATNRYAMFDEKVASQTRLEEGPLTVNVAAGYCNAVAGLNIVGDQFDLVVRKGLGGPVIAERSVSLQGRVVLNFEQWLFSPLVQVPSVTLTDLPLRSDAHIEVTISGGGPVACGSLVFGRAHDLGVAEFGAQSELLSTARIEEDDWGVPSVRDGLNRRDLSASFWVPHEQMPRIEDVMTRLLGKTCVYITDAHDKFRWASTFGVATSLRESIEMETETLCSLNVKGFL